MMKVPLNGEPFGGAQVAAYIGAQSVLQRLNAVVPGRWRQEFRLLDPPPGRKAAVHGLPADHHPADHRGRRRTSRPSTRTSARWTRASRAGLKALYSDARKRAAVAAGIGAYLYTALEPVVLPIGPNDRQVQLIRRTGKPDLLALSPATEQWLRHGYQQRMSTDAVRRDLGEILAHGEPERGMGQGEAAEQPARGRRRAEAVPAAAGEAADGAGEAAPASGNGVVVVDFRGLGPDAA